jgi:hypothetical protein
VKHVSRDNSMCGDVMATGFLTNCPRQQMAVLCGCRGKM